MFMKPETGANAKEKGKIVVLSHDIAYRKHEITGGEGQKEELLLFLELATNAGYTFRTLDTYFSD